MVTKGVGSFRTQGCYDGGQGMGSTRMKSQLNFSSQESLSQISEISISDVGESMTGHNGSDDAAGNIGQSYMSGNFPIGSWDDTNAIVFSPPHSKRMKDINGNVVSGFHGIESQFSLPQTSLEMATVEKLLQMQPDSTPCRIRAKRGCATHPRSIAERDRRTRISEKLKKLQELVPNMDKQTNTAEMLDLAVQHIKTLQSQIQDHPFEAITDGFPRVLPEKMSPKNPAPLFHELVPGEIKINPLIQTCLHIENARHSCSTGGGSTRLS
ncbi:hypothetical protein ACLOJK_009086 [Asimina triloba]